MTRLALLKNRRWHRWDVGRRLVKLLKEAKARKHVMEEFGAAYCAHGLMTLAGSRLYTSMADTDEVIDEALDRFDDALKLAC